MSEVYAFWSQNMHRSNLLNPSETDNSPQGHGRSDDEPFSMIPWSKPIPEKCLSPFPNLTPHHPPQPDRTNQPTTTSNPFQRRLPLHSNVFNDSWAAAAQYRGVHYLDGRCRPTHRWKDPPRMVIVVHESKKMSGFLDVFWPPQTMKHNMVSWLSVMDFQRFGACPKKNWSDEVEHLTFSFLV